VDGKTLRDALGAGGDGRPVHLLAAMDHASRAVLAPRQLGGAPEEVPAFAPLLAPLNLTGVVVTADALQTHPEAAEFLVGDRTRDRGHGRVERRSLKAVSVRHFGFPHAGQVIQVNCKPGPG
jgi:hypothetical protein